VGAALAGTLAQAPHQGQLVLTRQAVGEEPQDALVA
jgi:hypothetical protein